jgi:hypothetical protein
VLTHSLSLLLLCPLFFGVVFFSVTVGNVTLAPMWKGTLLEKQCNEIVERVLTGLKKVHL